MFLDKSRKQVCWALCWNLQNHYCLHFYIKLIHNTTWCIMLIQVSLREGSDWRRRLSSGHYCTTGFLLYVTWQKAASKRVWWSLSCNGENADNFIPSEVHNQLKDGAQITSKFKINAELLNHESDCLLCVHQYSVRRLIKCEEFWTGQNCCCNKLTNLRKLQLFTVTNLGIMGSIHLSVGLLGQTLARQSYSACVTAGGADAQ